MNFLNPTINDFEFLNFKNIKSIQGRDFKTYYGIFFLNNSFSTSKIKKLKLFNFFKNDNLNNKILFTKDNNINTNLVEQLKFCSNLKTHLHLPNSVFF